MKRTTDYITPRLECFGMSAEKGFQGSGTIEGLPYEEWED